MITIIVLTILIVLNIVFLLIMEYRARVELGQEGYNTVIVPVSLWVLVLHFLLLTAIIVGL